MLDSGRHGEFSTCSKCFADQRTQNFPFDYETAMAGVRPIDEPVAAIAS
jgi:hypothetical protein